MPYRRLWQGELAQVWGEEQCRGIEVSGYRSVGVTRGSLELREVFQAIGISLESLVIRFEGGLGDRK